MGTDTKAAPAVDPSQESRSRDEVLRDVKIAIAQQSNYGREARARGSNPYESTLGTPQQDDIWGRRRRPA